MLALYGIVVLLGSLAVLVFWLRNVLPWSEEAVDIIWGVLAMIATLILAFQAVSSAVRVAEALFKKDMPFTGIALAILAVLFHILIFNLTTNFSSKCDVYLSLRIEKRKSYTVLSQVFSKDYAKVILNLFYLAIDTEYFRPAESSGVNIRGLYTGNTAWFNPASKLVEAIESLINTSLSVDEKYEGQLVEATMLTAKNTAKLSFLMNVLEDPKKMDFLLTDTGEGQRKLLVKDLEELVKELDESLVATKEVQKKTNINSMNDELIRLRRNSFSQIEDMKRGE